MNEVTPLQAAYLFAIGTALGVFFFGGLWWTVRRGLSCAHPARLFLLSTVIRMTVLLVGLYYAGGTLWQRWLVLVIGIVVTKFVLTLRLGNPRLSRRVEDHAS